MNSLLRRQLKKHCGNSAFVPQDCQAFIDAVGKAYDQFDDDRKMLERSLELSSAELIQANAQMRAIYDTAPASIWQQDWKKVMDAIEALREKGITAWTSYFCLHPKLVTRLICSVRVLDINHWTLQMFQAKDRVKMLDSLEVIFNTPDTIPRFIEVLSALANGERVYRTEMALRTVLGERIQVLMTMSLPVFGTESGHVLMSVIDITERKNTEEELRRSEEHYRLLFDTMLQGVVCQSGDGRITSMNPAAIRILGKSPENFLNQTSVDTEGDTIREDGTHFPGQEHPSMLALNTGQEIRDVVMGVRNPCENVYRWIEISAVPLFRKGESRPYQVYTIFNDITERKRSEEKVRILHEQLATRARDLEEANRELEAFSYSVSHDLRAPLRSIDGFSRILTEDYYDQLDEEGRENLRTICAASQRMGQLIDDLLQLARITRDEIHRAPVDLSSLACEVMEDLKKGEPERRVEWVVEPNMMAEGDARLLRIVLVNLLGNAWKFTGRQSIARIQFERLAVDGETVYFIRDNGVGFDMTYANKLFNPFKRLHTTREFPGTGVGLATVQRIIRRHGGSVWAESQEGHGATFYFTLPQNGDHVS